MNSTNNSTIPDKNENYKSVEYWDERYSHEESYEWCKDYSAVRELFQNHVPKGENTKILVIGCGNSNFSLDLYNDGYTSITNIDYSPVVVEKMAAKYGHLMSYQVMDMRYLEFNQKFDVVIDKSTIDVLYTAEKSMWNLNETTIKDVNLTLASIKNILNTNGKFISITFAEPYFRKQMYIKYWDHIQVESYGTGFHYYFYICK